MKVHLQRLHAQLLTEPSATDPVEVVERITAVQAQDPRGFRLAIRSRSRVASASEVDRCLTRDRTLVVDWLCRGTLHLVRAEDHAWLHALTTPQLRVSNERRLRQEGVSPANAERGVAVIERALGAEGPLTRDQLRERLDAEEVPTARQALVHVLFAASLRGVCLRGPVVDGEQAFVGVVDWLGPRPKVDRDVALKELALRYLAGHGPASAHDLSRWAGLPLRDARQGLAALGARLVDPGEGLVDLPRRSDEFAVPAPRLLGAFDPVLHGWISRETLLGKNGANVVTSNGIFRPFALVDGRAVATWGLAGGKVTVTPLPREKPDVKAARALQADAAAVVRYLAG